jgi:hypothetical protein
MVVIDGRLLFKGADNQHALRRLSHQACLLWYLKSMVDFQGAELKLSVKGQGSDPGGRMLCDV